jgi:hypothetical protein
MDDRYKPTYNIEVISGKMNYHLHVFGDFIAGREGYKEHSGIDAIHFFLIQKYNWLPSQVKSMSMDDLRFLMEEEMSGWTIPENARPKD